MRLPWGQRDLAPLLTIQVPSSVPSLISAHMSPGLFLYTHISISVYIVLVVALKHSAKEHPFKATIKKEMIKNTNTDNHILTLIKVRDQYL